MVEGRRPHHNCNLPTGQILAKGRFPRRTLQFMMRINDGILLAKKCCCAPRGNDDLAKRNLVQCVSNVHFKKLRENGMFRKTNQIGTGFTINFSPVVRLVNTKNEQYFLIAEIEVGKSNFAHGLAYLTPGRPELFYGDLQHLIQGEPAPMRIDENWEPELGKSLARYWKEASGAQQKFEQLYATAGVVGGFELYHQIDAPSDKSQLN
jgi:hypothetical protein